MYAHVWNFTVLRTYPMGFFEGSLVFSSMVCGVGRRLEDAVIEWENQRSRWLLYLCNVMFTWFIAMEYFLVMTRYGISHSDYYKTSFNNVKMETGPLVTIPSMGLAYLPRFAIKNPPFMNVTVDFPTCDQGRNATLTTVNCPRKKITVKHDGLGCQPMGQNAATTTNWVIQLPVAPCFFLRDHFSLPRRSEDILKYRSARRLEQPS